MRGLGGRLFGKQFDHAGDEAPYAALMNAGVTFAQRYDLRPGIALSAAQVAHLTSDIVWLETQTVTLEDGSTQQVLVPKVYLASVGPNAVRPNGALITGDDVRIEGDIVVNRGGTLGGSGTQRLVVVASADIVNQGGTLQAGNIGQKAGDNIRNATDASFHQVGKTPTGLAKELAAASRFKAGGMRPSPVRRSWPTRTSGSMRATI